MNRLLVDRQRGLTLIELLVALVMGLVLLAGVVTVFIANRETYNVQDGLARVQENGRFAMSRLVRELRDSGRWGCASVRPVALPLNTVRGLFATDSEFGNFSRPVNGFEVASAASWTPSRDPQFGVTGAPEPSIGTDVLLIRAVDGPVERVISHGASNAPLIVLGAAANRVAGSLDAGDLAIVSDCEVSAVFQVNGTPGDSGGGTAISIPSGIDLGKQFPSAGLAAEVQRIRSLAFFVAPSIVTPGEPALWQWDGLNDPVELVEGVEDFQIRFSESTDQDDDVEPGRLYLTADAVGNWNNVVSVRVTLVVRSPQRGITPAGSPQRLTVDGSAWTAPDDTRLRQVFTAVVTLRNRHS